jgi:hypothetical protein
MTMRSLAPRMGARAAELSAALRSQGIDRVWVQPTVVLWGVFEQRSIQSNGVAWIEGRNLAAVLLARPTTLTPDRIREATSVSSAGSTARRRPPALRERRSCRTAHAAALTPPRDSESARLRPAATSVAEAGISGGGKATPSSVCEQLDRAAGAPACARAVDGRSTADRYRATAPSLESFHVVDRRGSACERCRGVRGRLVPARNGVQRHARRTSERIPCVRVRACGRGPCDLPLQARLASTTTPAHPNPATQPT